MHGADSFKVADVQQAKNINAFRNARMKVLKTSAAMRFKKIRKTKKKKS
jgi:hypothetical protein